MLLSPLQMAATLIPEISLSVCAQLDSKFQNASWRTGRKEILQSVTLTLFIIHEE